MYAKIQPCLLRRPSTPFNSSQSLPRLSPTLFHSYPISASSSSSCDQLWVPPSALAPVAEQLLFAVVCTAKKKR
ncbi:hypothetical protein B296_00006012 [Ensete ventricosum]|uniref:Uncharacterized protein n=1 Tax=Ensete ventricosum TaxID=4639 RepID=A0A426Z409_ENSVE|nr:hypothetical protein B296_00006012 [Ensete ventricosum]